MSNMVQKPTKISAHTWLKILSLAFNLASRRCYSWWIAGLRRRSADLIWIVAWSFITWCHRSHIHTYIHVQVSSDVQRLLRQQNQQLNWLLWGRRWTVDTVDFTVYQPALITHKLSPISFRSPVGEIKVVKVSDGPTQSFFPVKSCHPHSCADYTAT